MIRIGEVWTINLSQKTLTVRWPDEGRVSGPLYVLHSAWPPEIGDSVVVQYLPCQDGDGIVLGVVEQ